MLLKALKTFIQSTVKLTDLYTIMRLHKQMPNLESFPHIILLSHTQTVIVNSQYTESKIQVTKTKTYFKICWQFRVLYGLWKILHYLPETVCGLYADLFSNIILLPITAELFHNTFQRTNKKSLSLWLVTKITSDTNYFTSFDAHTPNLNIIYYRISLFTVLIRKFHTFKFEVFMVHSYSPFIWFQLTKY